MLRGNFVARITLAMVTTVVLVIPQQATAGSSNGIGGGFSSGPDQFLVSGRMELGRVFEAARFVPSADLGFGQNITAFSFNADVRWYLGRLPDSGLRFYGSAGPTLAHYSGNKGGSATELGLSLTAGMKIPTRSGNGYNFELRFGFGDIPDFKAVFHVMFGNKSQKKK